MRSASHGDPGCWVHRWHVGCTGHAGTPCRHAALKAALEDAAATAFGSSQHVLVMPHHEQQRRPTRHRKNYRESPDTLQTRSFILRTRSLSHTPAGVGGAEGPTKQQKQPTQQSTGGGPPLPHPNEKSRATPVLNKAQRGVSDRWEAKRDEKREAAAASDRRQGPGGGRLVNRHSQHTGDSRSRRV